MATSGNPLEVWQRTIIDLLWEQKCELSTIEPPPPLAAWYTSGMLPELAAITIMQQYTKPQKKIPCKKCGADYTKKPQKKTRKATTMKKDTKPLRPPARSNQNCHYILEKDQAGTITYYVTRNGWTQNLAAAKFFTNPTHARTEAHLLPDGYETGVGIRTINLIPADIEIAQPDTL